MMYFCSCKQHPMQITDFTVRSTTELNVQNHLIKVTPSNNEVMPELSPGQFVQILVENSPNVFLRRPISINYADREKNELWLLIQRVGEGTRKICEARPGDTMNLIYPLGNSFTLPKEAGRFLLIGGGVGTAPLLFLGKELHKRQLHADFLLGGTFRKRYPAARPV